MVDLHFFFSSSQAKEATALASTNAELEEENEELRADLEECQLLLEHVAKKSKKTTRSSSSSSRDVQGDAKTSSKDQALADARDEIARLKDVLRVAIVEEEEQELEHTKLVSTLVEENKNLRKLLDLQCGEEDDADEEGKDSSSNGYGEFSFDEGP